MNKVSNVVYTYFNEYKKWTDSIVTYIGAGSGSHEEIKHLTLGLNGEAGEVADLVKKEEMPNKVVTIDMKSEEMGDLFWYWCRLCYAFGLNPVEVIEHNRRKLEARYGKAGQFGTSVE